MTRAIHLIGIGGLVLGGSQEQSSGTGLPPVDYSLTADSQPQAGVPKGTVTRYVLAPGKFFPGTPHNYQVYVPAQYEASRPTAFMIFLDGSGYAGDRCRSALSLVVRCGRSSFGAIACRSWRSPAEAGHHRSRSHVIAGSVRL